MNFIQSAPQAEQLGFVGYGCIDWEGRKYQRNTEYHWVHFFYGFLEKLHEVEQCFLRWVLCVGFLLLVLQYLQVCPKQNLEVKKMHGWCLKMLVVTVRISPTRTQIEIVVPSSWSSKKAAACEISWYNCFNVAVCYVSFGLICKDKSQPNFEVLQNLEFPKFQTRGKTECLGIPKWCN